MKGIKSFEILKNPGLVPIADIPVLDYSEFRKQTSTLLVKESYHCVNYFTSHSGSYIDFYILVANDDSHKILVYSHRQPANIKSLESISKESFQLHIFEREIYEKSGILFEGHPWLKPVRYPHDRAVKELFIRDYPFYKIESEETHEVGVGPIHAGIIEPGHFRFLCYGEKVQHLEIQLGYQHRGVEDVFLKKTGLLQRSVLSECIAGDTAVGHSLAFTQAAEALAGVAINQRLSAERIIALELERMAVHVGDTAALCGDVAYQVGQVTCEALRTMIINTTQDWCGNRFGKGIIRPGGTNYPLRNETADLILDRLKEISRRFVEVTDLIYNDSGVLARFENTGPVSRIQAHLAGAVGMAARTSGIQRDIRKTHPFQAYSALEYKPALLESGDVLARAMLRRIEFELSYSVINKLVAELKEMPRNIDIAPDYSLKFKERMLCVSLVEGWRGEICHTAITDADGKIVLYKIKDPSLHNWHVLALAVREQEISDFPVCNKSFNLSYCGFDL